MAGTDNLHAIQAVLLLLLALVAAFAVLAQRLKVPYPIVLVVAGLGISFVPHVPRIPLNPDLVFSIFLPPLLYAAAWQTSWREFRLNLVPISMMAIGLVGFTVWGVAEVADRFISALDWKSGLLLGAVVATTDAIAATSIARSIGLPKGITDLLEGESLLNDATGLLALEFGLRLLLRGESPSVMEGFLRLLWLIAGGVGVGLLMGVLASWIERLIDDGPVEIVISMVVPYLAYLAGEGVRGSGVLSVVACGLFLSRKSAGFFAPEVRIQVVSVWNALNFVLNGIVFVLIGLQLPYVLSDIHGYGRWTLLKYGAVFSAVLIVLRLLWMFPGAEISFQVRTVLLKQKIERRGWRGIFVVGWTGMRGVVALAAAISLPMTLGDGQPFAQRNLIVFLTFSVILVTLVVQGLTLPALIRRLGLAGRGEGGEEEVGARRALLHEAILHLQRGRAQGGPELAHGYDDLLHTYRHRLSALDGKTRKEGQGGTEAYRQLASIAQETMQVERRSLIRMRDEGKIGDDTLRLLERELDLTETRQKVDEAR